MKQDLIASSFYPDKTGLSNPRSVRAIVEWPNGLEGPPRIFPFGDSLEEAERVGDFLEERLANQSSQAGPGR